MTDEEKKLGLSKRALQEADPPGQRRVASGDPTWGAGGDLVKALRDLGGRLSQADRELLESAINVIQGAPPAPEAAKLGFNPAVMIGEALEGDLYTWDVKNPHLLEIEHPNGRYRVVIEIMN